MTKIKKHNNVYYGHIQPMTYQKGDFFEVQMFLDNFDYWVVGTTDGYDWNYYKHFVDKKTATLKFKELLNISGDN